LLVPRDGARHAFPAEPQRPLHLQSNASAPHPLYPPPTSPSEHHHPPHHHPYSTKIECVGRDGNPSIDDRAFHHDNSYRPADEIRMSLPPPPPKIRGLEPVIDVSAPSRRCLNIQSSLSFGITHYPHGGARHCNLERGIPIDSNIAHMSTVESRNVALVPNHHRHVVQCQQCHLLMHVSKLTIVVQCPDCNAVSPAGNTRVVGRCSIAVASALPERFYQKSLT
jgi:hypothetical protein